MAAPQPIPLVPREEPSVDAVTRAGSASAPPPLDLLREYPTPSFTEEDVPPAVWRFASAFSAATGFDRNGLIGAAVVAASAAVDDRYRLAVRPKSNWFTSARMWGVIIGNPSAGKTPTLRAASDPIKEMHRELLAQWAKENEAKKAQAEKHEQKDADVEADPRPALFTSDATIEKMADLLRDNPRGMFMLTEEFATWIGGIDTHKDGAGAKARGEWLQLYDGGHHQIDRVGRGSMFVPNWSSGVLAAATPAGLRQQLKSLPEDGLIHRFIPVMMGTPGPEADADASGALAAWNRLLRRVFKATTRADGSPTLRITAGAMLDFDAERAAIRQAQDALSDVAPGLASHLGKHPGMIARVALTFHALDGRQGDAIEADTMRWAIRFMRVIRGHAAALFDGILGQGQSLDLARAMARSILADKRETVSRNFFAQQVRSWRKALDDEQRRAVQLLVDAGWLIPDEDSRLYGGWFTNWFVRPEVHVLFAEHGAKHMERRAAIRSILRGDDAE